MTLLAAHIAHATTAHLDWRSLLIMLGILWLILHLCRRRPDRDR